MSQITNYGELAAQVTSYMYNRSDLAARIPEFVQLCELEMYRSLESRHNEVEVTGTVDADNNLIPIPGSPKYKSVKQLTVNDYPLERISELSWQSKIKNDNAGGEPQQFCRRLGNFKMWPAPDTIYAYSLVIYAKYALDTTDDDDSNNVLVEAPDLYLYGVLLAAAPWLGDDERLPVWKTIYDTAMETLNEETADEEYSGHINQVSQPYGD